MNTFHLLLSLPGGIETLVILGLGIAVLIFWIKMIIEIANSNFQDPNMKVVWLLIVILLGVLGAVIYLIAGRNSRINQ